MAPRNIPWVYILPIITLLLAITIPLLLLYSARAVLEATDGQLDEVTDPAAPGFEVLIEATPSFLAFGVDGNDTLTSITVIVLANQDEGGTVLFMPPETTTPGEAPERVVDVFELHGPDAARLAVAQILDANFTDFQVLDDQGWARLTTTVTPLEVPLSDDLTDASGTTAFSAGTVPLAAAQVSDFVGWLNPGESPFNRMTRQRALWTAWVNAVSASDDPGAVPGEVDVGLGRFIRGLADGLVLYREVPVSSTPDANPVSYQADQIQLGSLVADIMPFPVPVEPGARPRVRLLDGVGDVDVLRLFARDLALNGAQIVRAGNATEFGQALTVVVYHDDRFAQEANAFGDLLAAQVRFEPLLDAVLDITVIVGQDRATG